MPAFRREPQIPNKLEASKQKREELELLPQVWTWNEAVEWYEETYCVSLDRKRSGEDK
ncbi:hypothetical protein HYPGJ_30396 [Hyphomicrobium sp. GJ21]|nr:hypothetical protein HYPGJ_30396 [Hyphomicrobium sp. GJ21]